MDKFIVNIKTKREQDCLRQRCSTRGREVVISHPSTADVILRHCIPF